MAASFLFSPFLPRNSIKPGRFITNIKTPNHNYHDPVWSTPIEVTTSPLNNYTYVRTISASSGFKTSFTALLSAECSKQASTEVTISTDNASTSSVDNAQVRFKEAMQLTATRAWVEEQFDQGDQIYMIVGFIDINNAHGSTKSFHEGAAQGQAQLPTAPILAATGAVVPLVGDLLDPSLGASRQASRAAQSEFLVPGNQICALQLCKIKHTWYKAKNLDKSRLSEPWWPSDEIFRGGEDDDDEENIIEVELSEVEDSVDEWAKVVDGGEVFFTRSSENS